MVREKPWPGFASKLRMEPVEGTRGRKIRLLSALLYRTAIAEIVALLGTPLLEVPRGFVSDGNSLPRLARVSSTPLEFPEAGVLHDWACQHMPRKLADRLYREALGVLGAGAIRRSIRFAGVRVGGWLGIGPWWRP